MDKKLVEWFSMRSNLVIGELFGCPVITNMHIVVPEFEIRDTEIKQPNGNVIKRRDTKQVRYNTIKLA